MTENVVLTQQNLDYFRRGEYENPRFWERIGEKPNFSGATVLEVGCGHGSLCVHIAEAGAERVVGLDINPSAIAFASENVRRHHARFDSQIEFFCGDLAHYPAGEQFDLVVSRNTFEHIVNLSHVVSEIEKRLKPGGRLYTGFGPLYSSPFGLHGAAVKGGHVRFPWLHLMIGDARAVRRWSNANANSVSDLGMNKLTPGEYRQVFEQSGLSVVRLQLNRPRDRTPLTTAVSATFSLLRKLPFLEKYFTFNMYYILEKPAG